ncbi:MAG TPA: ABC transporter permease [Anaerolineae bacterium]|nr:ABC transporter permease [Anaerolineae bacterium]
MRSWRRAFKNRQVRLACLILGGYILVAMLAPVLAPPDDPGNPGTARIVGRPRVGLPQPPSREALLGTTPQQFDVYYSVVWGTRSALRFGLVVTLSTALLGTLLGAVSGYAGGIVHSLILRIGDGFLAFPVLAAVWLIGQVLLPANIWVEPTRIQQVFLNLHLSPVLMALIVFSWVPYTRLVSVTIRQLKQADYIMAARAVGVRGSRILRRHLLPNALAPAIVMAARDVGAMVVLAAAFQFIGMGGGTAWGELLAVGRDYIVGAGGNPLAYWWVFLPATLALILFGVGWNLLGDGLNAVLDPRMV